MKYRVNKQRLAKWVDENGGTEADRKILGTLDCSLSTLIKIKAGSYPSTLRPAKRKALADLLNMKMDELFIPEEDSGKNAS